LTAFDVPKPGMQAVDWQLNWWERLWEEDVPFMRLTMAWTIRSTFGHLAVDSKTFLVGGFMPENQFLDLYRELSGMTVDAKRLDFYKIFNAYKNVLIILATGRRVASGGKGHQDVLLAWLSGVGYTMLEDMWSMLNELL
jgi:aminoglycoside phosphotransferase (APT) family kinase protein